MIDTEDGNRIADREEARRRWLPWAIGLGLIVAVAIGGLFWFFAGDAPAEVDLTETVSAVERIGRGRDL